MGTLSISQKPAVKDMLEHLEALEDHIKNIEYCEEFGSFDDRSKIILKNMQERRKANRKAVELDLIAEYSAIDIRQVWEHEEMNAPERIDINKK